MRLLLDGDDDHAVHRAACQWADATRGRITVDPTAHTTSPAYLALDVLRAMGRDGFPRGRGEDVHRPGLTGGDLLDPDHPRARGHCAARPPRLTAERLHRLAAWRADTGIRLEDR
ncbi:hypothetical protein NKH18_51065 [Streptomyces sp. M10(2022)]